MNDITLLHFILSFTHTIIRYLNRLFLFDLILLFFLTIKIYKIYDYLILF
jgi:hypothetical protein